MLIQRRRASRGGLNYFMYSRVTESDTGKPAEVRIAKDRS